MGTLGSQRCEIVKHWVPARGRRWLGTALVLVGVFLLALEGLNLSMPARGQYPSAVEPQSSQTWVHRVLLAGGGLLAFVGAWIVLKDHVRSGQEGDRE